MSCAALVVASTVSGVSSALRARPDQRGGSNAPVRTLAGAMRSHDIDAPEVPGNCRSGRACVTGNPTARRDHLRLFARNSRVNSTAGDRDNHGQRFVPRTAVGVELFDVPFAVT